MIKLFKNADIYSPQYLGIQDILVCDEKIVAIEHQIQLPASAWLETIDLNGARVVPGYIDGHVHITGGGGEQGYASRVRESSVDEIARAGVTTVLGLLGTDSVTRSLENLYAKACALEQQGISAYILTGAYTYPSPVLTDCVRRDVALIDKVIGVKIAVSDHRSAAITPQELAKLAAQARVGGMLGSKAGLVVVHMGAGKGALDPILQVLAQTDLPPATFLPTHCTRSEQLFSQVVAFAKNGGNFDLTAVGSTANTKDLSAAHYAARALREGVDVSHITISSDAYGSQPIFNEKMECIKIDYSRCDTLHTELLRLIEEESLALETALKMFTVNVAQRMGLSGKKGALIAGADADFMVWDAQNQIERVFARGKQLYNAADAAQNTR